MELPRKIEHQLTELFNAAVAERISGLPDIVRESDGYHEFIIDLHYAHYDLLTTMEKNGAAAIMKSITNHQGTAAECYDHLCFIAYTTGFPAPPMRGNTSEEMEYIKELAHITRG